MAYDIFISYRRQGGAEKARPLKSELERRGYRVFLDFDELKDGVFDQRIMNAIDEAPIFLIILSANSLDRCCNEQDWVRKEIEYAIEKNKHFVPVNPNKEFGGFPANVPENVKTGLGLHQFSHIDFEQLFAASIEKMISERIEPYLNGAQHNKRDNRALVRVEADIDCRALRFGREQAIIKAGEITEMRLPKGKHRLSFVGVESELDRYDCTIDIKDSEYEMLLEIELLPQYEARKLREAEEQRLAEEEAILQKQAELERLRQEIKAERRRRFRKELKKYWWAIPLAVVIVVCLYIKLVMDYKEQKEIEEIIPKIEQCCTNIKVYYDKTYAYNDRVDYQEEEFTFTAEGQKYIDAIRKDLEYNDEMMLEVYALYEEVIESDDIDVVRENYSELQEWYEEAKALYDEVYNIYHWELSANKSKIVGGGERK